jgi:hypothetical protein
MEVIKMKKIITFLITIGFLISIFSVNANSNDNEELEISLLFSEPLVSETDNFISINSDYTNSYIFHTGEPVLPIYKKTITFPFTTKIIDIKFKISEVKTIELSKKILPGPKPVIQGLEYQLNDPVMNEEIYDSDMIFPVNWIKYSTHGGVDENFDQKTFFILKVFPYRYNPVENIIYYFEHIDLTIIYEKPDIKQNNHIDEYEMVIITPSSFSNDLQELVDHKNSMGMNTFVKTTEDIYNEFTGVDKPEQIKYFIKQSIEDFGIKYVLLIGGMKSLLWG